MVKSRGSFVGGIALFCFCGLPIARAHGPPSYGSTVGPFISSPEQGNWLAPGAIHFIAGAKYLHYRAVAGRSPFAVGSLPLRMDIGLASNVAMTIAWDVRLRHEEDQTFSGPGDVTVETKVRLFAERGARPALGFTFLTKLPNARDNPAHLGSDATDFLANVVLRHGPFAGNVGLAVLGSSKSTPGDNQQDDFATFGFLWSHPLMTRLGLLAGTSGFLSARHRDDYGYAMVGVVGVTDAGLWRLMLRRGLTHDSEALGVGLEFTVVVRSR